MCLSDLTTLNGVSGNEDAVRKYIYEKIKSKCDNIKIDTMGNIIAFKKGKKAIGKKVMVCAHMDEVGFIVSRITDDGFLKFKTVGGIDPRVIISKFVTVGKGAHVGVIGTKAIHLMTPAERKASPKISDLYIDIGAKTKKEAEKRVSVGDYVAFKSDYTEFGDDLIKAKALDDRVGCDILMSLCDDSYDFDLYLVFTVQEEVGLRGAQCATYSIKPDIAVVLEGTTCSDVSGVKESGYSTILGGGAALSFIDNRTYYNKDLFNYIYNLAKEKNIPVQIKQTASGGNDAGVVHLSTSGVKTAAISVPARYIHSPSSVISKKDYEACKELIHVLLKEISL